MPTKPKKNRRVPKGANIVTAMEVVEFSAVEVPAQPFARNATIKGGKRKNLADFATSSVDGHVHGIEISTYDGEIRLWVSYAVSQGSETSHTHELLRGADGSIEVLENDGHTHTIDNESLNSAVIAALSIKLADAGDARKKGEGKESAMNAETRKLLEGAMTPDHKGFYDSLPEADREGFLSLDHDGREKAVAKAAKSDAVVYTAADGTEYRKSADPALVALAQKQDATAKALAEAQAKSADADVTKRAEAIKNLPGDIDVRKAMVKAIDSIEDDETRAKAQEALASADKAMGGAFVSVGKSGEGDASPEVEAMTKAEAVAELDRLAKEKVKNSDPEKPLTFAKAHVAAQDENPALTRKAMERTA